MRLLKKRGSEGGVLFGERERGEEQCYIARGPDRDEGRKVLRGE